MKNVKTQTRQKETYPGFLNNDFYLDQFLDWANANPKLFDKKYPELSQSLTEGINSMPEIVAAAIEKLPKLFPVWLENANQLIGTPRTNQYKHIISILQGLLNKIYDDPIIENSRRKMEPICYEYIAIVNSLLVPPKQRNKIGFLSDRH